MDWQKLKESVQLSPGEKITIEAKGQVVEMTATGLTIRERILTSDALQHALAAHQITKEIRNALVFPSPDTEAIKKLAGDLIHAGEYLKKWAEQ